METFLKLICVFALLKNFLIMIYVSFSVILRLHYYDYIGCTFSL